MQKTKLNVKVICFWILLIYTVISAIRVFVFNGLNYKIKGLIQPLADVTINLTLKQDINNEPLMCFENNCFCMYKYGKSNTYNLNYSKRELENNYPDKIIKNYYIAIDKTKNLEDVFDDIYFYINEKQYHYDNPQGIEKINNFTSDLKDNNSYNYYKLPDIFPTNYNGFFANLITFFLSIFYHWKILWPFWLSGLICFSIYYFNKEEFNFKFEIRNIHTIIFFIILTLGALIRLYMFRFKLYSPDEMYTIYTAIKSFIACFQDAGNPPFFFILEYLMSGFSTSIIAMRILSFLFSIGFCYMTYKLFSKINNNLALFMMFFASINIISICYSNVARSYSLCMLLIIVITYYFLKYLKLKDNKNLYVYAIFSIMAINTHYLLAIYTLGNFLWGLIKLKKDRSSLIKFIISQAIVFISFIPYLLIVSKTAFSDDFNSWIKPLSVDLFRNIVRYYFDSIPIFIAFCILTLTFIALCFIKFKNIKINNFKKELFLYLCFSLFFNILVQIIISFYVKPIINPRILSAIYPLLFLLEGMLITTIYDIKYNYIKNLYSIGIILLCFLITKSTYGYFFPIDNYLYFIKTDSKKYLNAGYQIHVLAIDSVMNVKNLENKIILHKYTSESNIINKINKNDYISSNKKAVLYMSSLYTDTEKVKQNIKEKADIYENMNSCKFLRIIFD